MLLKQGKVNQVVRSQLCLILSELDQNVVCVQVTVLETDDRVDQSGLAPTLSLTGVGQRIRVHVALDQKPASIRPNVKNVFEERVNIPP